MLKQAHFKFSVFTGRILHLGVSGSIAAYKMLDLIRAWKNVGINVSVTLTKGATNFVTPMSFSALGASHVYGEMFDDKADSCFAHLEPGQEADVMVIAPATASTISRLATGSAEEMLAAQALAFDGPTVISPAMHPKMWANKATQANWATLKERGYICVEPACGQTACGEQGEGRMTDVREIYLAALKALSPQDLEGQTVLITIGPTREFWDGVRFISNPSSGLMGASLAIAAYLRGATVQAVCGPGVPWLPKLINRHEVSTANEMLDVCQNIWPNSTLGCFTAAVCDFKPNIPANIEAGEKLKKETLGASPCLQLEATPDVLRTLSQSKKDNQRIIAFAAETSELKENALKKMSEKNADMIVANIVGKPNTGFESPNNTVMLLEKSGKSMNLPAMPKADIAWRIWDSFLQL